MTCDHPEILAELIATASAIASPGKGILAADESTGTIGKRFDAAAIPNTEENRARYRELLFTTPNLGDYISGVILFEETLNQSGPSGKTMVELLHSQKMIPGIKVDKGLVDIPHTKESFTQGLDGLGDRLKDYYAKGARFAKWRCVLKIDQDNGLPSDLSINVTATTLAMYAAICQENRIVPIVEPEILQDGKHNIEHCAHVTERVLAACVKALHDHHVHLEGCLLKPNMVTPGAECPVRSSPDEIAKYTVQTLSRTIPASLTGVCFLSGGQSEEQASINLSAINAISARKPWALTFSYGRALQASTIKAWAGKDENKVPAQTVLSQRAKANSEAQKGVYAGTGEAGESLYVKNYTY
jgi:fructose-bisphosphate aldolase class I